MATPRFPSGRLLADVVAYQIGWLGCVLGAAHGHAWAGVTAAVALTAFHLALLGALGGPLAYLAGERLGAIDLAAGPVPLLVLAVAWGSVIPLLVGLSERLVPDERA